MFLTQIKLRRRYLCSILHRIVSLSTLSLALFISVLQAQSVRKLADNLPSVYLTYEGTAMRKGRCKGEEGEHLILRLHNNTSTYINVAADFNKNLEPSIIENAEVSGGTYLKVLKSGSEVELFYDVEGLYWRKGYAMPARAKVPNRDSPFCTSSYWSNQKSIEYPQNIGYWIKPGEYIKFGVLRSLLVEHSRVYTEFNFPWEFVDGKLGNSEARHKVVFYYSDLSELSGK